MIDEDYSMRDPKELVEAFIDTPEAIANTQIIADRCIVDFEL